MPQSIGEVSEWSIVPLSKSGVRKDRGFESLPLRPENFVAELKTQVNKASVQKFLNAIADKQRSADCSVIAEIMEKATKAKPEMWGAAIAGFGRVTYTYANGKTAEWMHIGFSPRKGYIALYGLKVFTMTLGGLKETKGGNDFLLSLGKYREGGSCLYIKRLADVNTKELEKIIKLAVRRKK